MTRHFNPSIVERAARTLNSKQGDFLPDEVAGPVAIIPLLPVLRIIRRAAATNTTNTTIYTTPDDQDFYLVGANLGMIKDATATSIVSRINVTLADGLNVNLLEIPGLTLTAQSAQLTQSWPLPGIKLKRGSAIAVQNTTATANVTAIACIQGYLEQTTQD